MTMELAFYSLNTKNTISLRDSGSRDKFCNFEAVGAFNDG
jgi:hypothetical protein